MKTHMNATEQKFKETAGTEDLDSLKSKMMYKADREDVLDLKHSFE